MRIETEIGNGVVISKFYNGFRVKCTHGEYGICERDGGIEILHKGKTIFRHTNLGDA